MIKSNVLLVCGTCSRAKKSFYLCRSALFFASMMVFMTSCESGRLHQTNLAAHLGGGRQIPDGFKTYSLFLVTSEWEAEDAQAKTVANLEKSFKEFGDTIGDHNLAVWV